MLKRVFLVGLCFILAFAYAEQELWDTSLGRERLFNALVDTFRDNYWDESYRDWDDWSENYRDQALDANSRDDFDRVLRRMVSSLQDDHSRWLGKPSVSNFDGSSSPSELPNGLGIQHDWISGLGLVVERVFTNTPAEEATLQRGDVIVSINGESLLGDSGDFTAGRLLGEAVQADSLVLGISRKGQELNLDIFPKPIDFSAVRDLPQGNMLDENTGYIYIPSFEAGGVAQRVHDLINDLEAEGAKSLVLDLRDNPGGRLGELGLMLGAFIDGPWVEAFSRGELAWRALYRINDEQGINTLENNEGRTIASEGIDNPANFSGSLAIIVSRFNSSAGEVGPLVLKEFDRATIIGEATEGNVEAIRTFDLPDGSLVYVAVANLQGIQGTNFTEGLEPDIEVRSSNLRELARGFDPPVAEALKALKDLPFTPGKLF